MVKYNGFIKLEEDGRIINHVLFLGLGAKDLNLCSEHRNELYLAEFEEDEEPEVVLGTLVTYLSKYVKSYLWEEIILFYLSFPDVPDHVWFGYSPEVKRTIKEYGFEATVEYNTLEDLEPFILERE